MVDYDVVKRRGRLESLSYDASVRVLWQWIKEGIVNLHEFKDLMSVLEEKKNA